MYNRVPSAGSHHSTIWLRVRGLLYKVSLDDVAMVDLAETRLVQTCLKDAGNAMRIIILQCYVCVVVDLAFTSTPTG